VKRKTLLVNLFDDERLSTLWYYFWRVKVTTSYVELGAGSRMTRGRSNIKKRSNIYLCRVRPSLPSTSAPPITKTNDEIRLLGAALISGADETYIIRPPHIDFACVHWHNDRVAYSGLSLHLNKTQYYIDSKHCSPEYHIICGYIAEGKVVAHEE